MSAFVLWLLVAAALVVPIGHLLYAHLFEGAIETAAEGAVLGFLALLLAMVWYVSVPLALAYTACRALGGFLVGRPRS